MISLQTTSRYLGAALADVGVRDTGIPIQEVEDDIEAEATGLIDLKAHDDGDCCAS